MLNRLCKFSNPLLLSQQILTKIPNHCYSCWKCNQPTSNLFCQSCSALQKPDDTKTYFQVLGISEDYKVDEGQLSKKFKELQKLLHPDKFSNKSPDEQKVSEEYSSLVNKAYSTVLSPLSRGIYLLGLKGVEISENTQVESKFLHEIMERNEEVENAETPEDILKIDSENRKTLNSLQDELDNCFKQGNISDAQNVLIRMKYYDSINNQIKGMITKMNIVK